MRSVARRTLWRMHLNRLVPVVAVLAILAVVPAAQAKRPSERARIHHLEQQVARQRVAIRDLRVEFAALRAELDAVKARTTKVEVVAGDALNEAQTANWCLVWSFVDDSFPAFLDPHCIKGRQSLAERMADGPTKP